MGRAARRRAEEHFDTAVVSRQVVGVYDELLGRARRRACRQRAGKVPRDELRDSWESGMKRLHVVHLINSLEIGGAERVLCALVGQIDPATTRTSIVTLLDGGPLKTMLVEQGIDVHSLGMSRRLPSPGAVVHLAKQLACRQPALLVTWLNHSNLIGGLAARMVGRIPVVWNIRHSTLQARIPTATGPRLVNWCAARLSPLASRSHTVFVGHAAPAEPHR